DTASSIIELARALEQENPGILSGSFNSLGGRQYSSKLGPNDWSSKTVGVHARHVALQQAYVVSVGRLERLNPLLAHPLEAFHASDV
ncbi:unnamed protein product, partial [Symbiodinium sp. KB8]